MDYGLIAFSSTYAAIYAQKALKPVAPVQVMPVLREISASCGIALRVEPAHWGAARAALAACELAPGEYAFYAVSFSPPALRVRPVGAQEP